jgi:hypothetical protein
VSSLAKWPFVRVSRVNKIFIHGNRCVDVSGAQMCCAWWPAAFFATGGFRSFVPFV